MGCTKITNQALNRILYCFNVVTQFVLSASINIIEIRLDLAVRKREVFNKVLIK